MNDQARILRRLVRQSSPTAPAAQRPKVVLVSSGKGGVGTTTIAVNLAAALAPSRQVLLADVDPEGGDASRLCQAIGHRSIFDVLAGQCRVEEIVETRPAGLRVLPGRWRDSGHMETPPIPAYRWLNPLASLAPPVDLVVADAGTGLNRSVERLWEAADLCLLVTTPETAAIVNSYALLKVLGAQEVDALPVCCVVNRVSHVEQADQVQARVAQAASRFLGLGIRAAGSIADDATVESEGKAGRICLHSRPHSRAMADIVRLADHVMAILTNTESSAGEGLSASA